MATLSVQSGSYTVIGAASLLGFTLSLAVGSYALTGTTASTVHGYRITAATGSYAVTGTLISIERINIHPGSYQVFGSDVTLLSNTRKVVANSGSYVATGGTTVLQRVKFYDRGSYTATGTAATLTPSVVTAHVNANPGSYTVAGTTTPLVYRRFVDSGDFNVTGTAATLRRGKGLGLAARAFVISGTAANLRWTHKFPAAVGAYSVTGVRANLGDSADTSIIMAADGGFYVVYHQVPGSITFLSVKLNAASGSYSLASVGTDSHPFITPGQYSATGTAATLSKTKVLDAIPGAYTVTGQTAILISPTNSLEAEGGQYTIAGLLTQVLAQHVLPTDDGVYTTQGSDAELLPSNLHPDIGVYLVAGSIARLTTTRPKRWRKNAKPITTSTKTIISQDEWDEQNPSPGILGT